MLQKLRGSGRAIPSLDDLAERLGFSKPEELFVAVARDELGLRQVADALVAPDPRDGESPADDAQHALRHARTSATSVASGARSGVLVVGVDALLTQLAKCCKPAPPDHIAGFVTRGRGVSIHRTDCTNLAAMRLSDPERMIATEWGGRSDAVYPVDVRIVAQDRQGLLRDISEVFSREKINVVGVQTESRRGMARMSFTAEVGDAQQLQKALAVMGKVSGVIEARRR